MIEAHDARYGLLTLRVRGGVFFVPAPRANIGEHRRIRVVAADVSLAPEPPRPSSILNVLPARIVLGKAVDPDVLVVVIASAPTAPAHRLLSRVTRKSWEQLGLAEGVGVHAQVKAVALGPRRGDVFG